MNNDDYFWRDNLVDDAKFGDLEGGDETYFETQEVDKAGVKSAFKTKKQHFWKHPKALGI